MANNYNLENKSTYSIFQIIYLNGEISLDEVAQILNKKYNTISEQIKPLIEKGFIETNKDELDKRKTKYTLNEKKVRAFLNINYNLGIAHFSIANNLIELKERLHKKGKLVYEEEGFVAGDISGIIDLIGNAAVATRVAELIEENKQLKRELNKYKKN
jgi:DNA-binding MarR family transcriptional regulator